MQWGRRMCLRGATGPTIAVVSIKAGGNGQGRTWPSDLVTGKERSGFTLSHSRLFAHTHAHVQAHTLARTHAITNCGSQEHDTRQPLVFTDTTFTLLSRNVKGLTTWFCRKLYA